MKKPRLTTILEQDDFDTIAAAAKRVGLTPAAFIRTAAIKAAREAME